MKRLIILILLNMSTLCVLGQVSISFIPEIQGRAIDGLLNCRIINSGVPLTVSMEIQVLEKRGKKVCSINTASFNIANGTTQIPRAAVQRTSIQFGDSDLARFTRQNGIFPQGEYEYIFNVYAYRSEIVILEQIFDYQLEPLTELLLTEPANQDVICMTRPMLSWQPSIPAVPGMLYRIVLAEIKGNQKATEALHFNYPLVNQSSVVTPALLYPPNARELEQGKKYAWQVTAYKGETVLNRSEIWEFKISCEDTVTVEIVNDEGYRDLEDLLKGNYYLATGNLKFTMINSYEEQQLKYTIEGITKPKKKVKRLPTIKLKRGKNKVFIGLQKKGFLEGNYYQLKVELPNGVVKTLRFLYKEKV